MRAGAGAGVCSCVRSCGFTCGVRACVQVETLGELSKLLMGTEGQPLQLTFSRGGATSHVSLTRSNAFLGAGVRFVP